MTLDEFVERYRAVDYWWEHLDRPILRACQEMPAHRNQREVFGKIALINRAYRANLQMGARDAEWNLARAMVEAKFDEFVRPIADSRCFDRGSLMTIMAAHEKFVRLAYGVTKRVENSFCAKYLSFHFPKVTPLFDSNAYGASWKLAKAVLAVGLYQGNWNIHYGYHCEAVLHLLSVLDEHGITEPDLKFVDYVLYSADAVQTQLSPLPAEPDQGQRPVDPVVLPTPIVPLRSISEEEIATAIREGRE